MADIRNAFTPPAPWRAWGGNPPTSFLSADGLVFYGMNAKDNSGALWYVVWSIDVFGAITERLRLGPNAGQGALDIDAGWLIVTLFRQAGDGQSSDRTPVPGWKVWPALSDADIAWVKAVRALG